jgi:hypothetical protein
MKHEKADAELVRDLEQRIDDMQAMDESKLGTFSRLDWIFLILISIVIPVIAVVLAR